MRSSHATAAALLLLALAPSAGRAQGALSTQGFGFPTGQLSVRALGAGGGTGETDPLSPVNPAALMNWGSSAVFFQASPEFRTVEAGGEPQKSTTSRYPLTMGALSLGPRAVVALSASTFLDRSWRTTEEGPIDLGGTPVLATTTYSSEGAINDVRFAGAYAWRSWLRLGAGLHAIVGRNRLSVFSQFSDSLAFTPLVALSTISYGGTSFSTGAEARLGDKWTLAGSLRAGGTISAERNDSTLSTADVPTRYGVQLGYLGMRNSVVAVRAAHEGWSSLSGLGGPALTAHDAWDLGAGADVAGPRFGRNTVRLRAGVRRRGLPFEAAGEKVTESSLGFGGGTVFANGRVFADLGVVRAVRSVPTADVRERAWTMNMGLAIQP